MGHEFTIISGECHKHFAKGYMLYPINQITASIEAGHKVGFLHPTLLSHKF